MLATRNIQMLFCDVKTVMFGIFEYTALPSYVRVFASYKMALILAQLQDI